MTDDLRKGGEGEGEGLISVNLGVMTSTVYEHVAEFTDPLQELQPALKWG